MGDAEDGEETEQQPTSLTMDVAAGGLSLLKDTNGSLNFNYTKLDMAGKMLIDLQDLHRYQDLRLLDVSNNQITDSSQIGNLPNLLSAKLDNNQLAALDGIGLHNCLQLLSLKGNQLTALPELDMPMLSYLILDSNQLTTLPSLERCTQLKTIEARENQLTTTAGIESLANLEEAHFATNAITEFVLGPAPALTKLNLSGNQITTLQALASNASNLEELDLGTNTVASVGELNHLSGLKQLRTLVLTENPVAGVDKYRNFVHAILPQLETLDGEPYSEEDREPPPEPPPEEDAPADE